MDYTNNKLNTYFFKQKLTNTISSSLSEIPPSPTHLLKAISGASQHYICSQDALLLQNVQQVYGPSVYLLDMDKITANQCGTLLIPQLSPSACRAHVFPYLKSVSLLSLGQTHFLYVHMLLFCIHPLII